MIGSLFSGVGGLELGLERATGLSTAWQCEYDRDASVVLTERFAVPNLHDITIVDWDDVQPVEMICGGFPCQPFSSAGRRKGTADERWMWPQFARCVRALRPRYVVVENVHSLIADSGAFGNVLGDLAEAGYDARWTCLRAADVGAPHRRERLFLVATDAGPGAEHRERARSESRQGGPGPAADTERSQPQRWRGLGQLAGPPSRTKGAAQQRQWVRSAAGDSGAASTDADWGRCSGNRLRGDVGRTDAGGRQASAAGCRSSRIAWGAYGPAIRRWEPIHGPAPAPVDARGRLNPAFVEWMMGFPPGWITDVLISRSAQLRCLGNAVVPHCAEMALHLLTGSDLAVAS